MDKRLKLIWKCEDKIFSVGELINRGSRYYFLYIEDEIKEAIKYGFKPLTGFPRLGSKYYSEQPFRLFSKWVDEKADNEELGFDDFKNLSYENFQFE